MKTAVVLFAANGSFDQIAQINSWLSERTWLSDAQAWLIYDINVEPNKDWKSLLANEVIFMAVEDIYDPSMLSSAIFELYTENKPELIIFEGSSIGDEQAVFLSCKTGASPCVGIEDLEEARSSSPLMIRKKVYTNHLNAKFACNASLNCVSLQRSMSHKSWPIRDPDYSNFTASINSDSDKYLFDRERIKEDTTDALQSSEFVVIAGRGVQNEANLKHIEETCKSKGWILAATRAIVMNGWMDQSRLIGASGAMIAPRKCLVLGASGSAAFTVGIQNSKEIIAVNTDPQAPIFKVADIGIIGDLCEIWEELIKRF